MSKKNRKIEPICKNCRLFNPDKNICRVIILHEGEKINLPVEENDLCFFENEFISIDNGTEEKFKLDVQEIKMWVEDPKTGEKTDQGIVKIEYPKSLDPDNI